MDRQELEEEKLKLEIRKLKQPFLLRPEFLGLIIPFITIFITYLLNKPTIDLAFKQREWQIEKDNWQIEKRNKDLKEEENKLIHERKQIRNQLDSLLQLYQVTSDSLKREISRIDLNRLAAINRLNKTESQLLQKPINDAIKYIKSKNYSFHDVKNYLYLIDSENQKINREILKDSINTTLDILQKVRLNFFLLRGTKNARVIDDIEKIIGSNLSAINSDVIREINDNTGYVGYNFPLQKELQILRFNSLEYIIENYRKGDLTLRHKSSYSHLLPNRTHWKDQNMTPHYIDKEKLVIPFYALYFKDIENYFELIRISLAMINDPSQYSDERRNGIFTLAELNRLVFLSKSYELLSENRLTGDESAAILQLLPDANYRTRYGPGWEGFEQFSLPTSINLEDWKNWKETHANQYEFNLESNSEKLFEQITDYWKKNRIKYE
ncbi:hypothetical protein [Roseivirga pacifica]|uniref:hypothetical protein n=1 Tax=Roseivirga pacifica TaxID=1267423 RepID=UPI002094F413|nr:hypothetical protein [Roseivirga pacifica]MCO6360642.1 hypothetical protein [Roseivirga pacifica]MCO6368531.1 hypothetical protein [Roseivirga pacifica]MCO6372673.1 hypothetical protein [Roseivirga pacifica]MCO6376731.1 hypothetical protein [Roseivirga pacifica]MCO6377989.1 hypothetical protein [Roseivirga pacifica]